MNDQYLLKKEILEDEKIIYLIEQQFDDNIQINGNIKINNIRIPKSTITIILTDNNDYIGHISANVYNNNTAALIMTGISNLKLSNELEKYQEIINKSGVAIYVDEQYRKNGNAKKLMNLMLNLLNERGITSLEVNSISNYDAINFYVNTGAVLLDDKNAIYENIENILNNKRR